MRADTAAWRVPADRPWLAVHEALGIAVPPQRPLPISAHVARHARRDPDRAALHYKGAEIGYGALDAAAGALAHGLARHGLGKGDVIAVHLPNIPQYILAILAASKLGCVISGLSPLLKPAELRHQLDDCRARALITLRESAAQNFGAIAAGLDALELVVATSPDEWRGGASGEPGLDMFAGCAQADFGALLGEGAAPAAAADHAPDDIAFIQYTGGTTGRSKGAMLSIRNVMYDIEQYNAVYRLEEYCEEIVSGFPLFHMAGVTVHLFALRLGARILLVPDPRDLDYQIDYMRAHPPSFIAAVPTLLQMFMDREDFGAIDFSGLKCAMIGAAPFPDTQKEALERIVGPGRISDAFGMTETASVYIATPPARPRPGSIGIPVPAADVRIVDLADGETELGPGEPGELVVSGPQVMRGYLGAPAETAKALRRRGGKTWLHTGDVGAMDEEGYVTLRDRAKDMLIVGGFKVFSVEVEEALKPCPEIALPALVGAPDAARPGNDIVHLFVEPSAAGAALSRAECARRIAAFCRGHLAAYKVPAEIHLVDAIPLTSIGKIDKKALRARLGGQPAGKRPPGRKTA